MAVTGVTHIINIKAKTRGFSEIERMKGYLWLTI
jgi:hypothetical protein